MGQKSDLIVTGGGAATRAAKEATSTIPIVTAQDPDPVGNGFVASLARPGGNITGLSTYAPELSGKRLELLVDVVPKLSRVAIIGTSTHPSYAQVLREIEPTAKVFGVKLQSLDVLDSKDIETAFRAAAKGRAGGVLTLNSPVLSSERRQLVALAVKNQLPAIYHQGRFVEEGGFIYYGVNLLDLDRRSATYVDKILKGRKPADLPVEQPKKFELIINLQAAKQIGLTVPPNFPTTGNLKACAEPRRSIQNLRKFIGIVAWRRHAIRDLFVCVGAADNEGHPEKRISKRFP